MEAIWQTLWVLPAIYFTAVALSWFLVHFVFQGSGGPRLLRTDVVIFPFVSSIAKGIFPGLAMSAVLASLLGIKGELDTVPIALGCFVSGMLLHKDLQLTAEDTWTWNWVVVFFSMLFLVGWALFIFNLID